jgi:hypothetical protein
MCLSFPRLGILSAVAGWMVFSFASCLAQEGVMANPKARPQATAPSVTEPEPPSWKQPDGKLVWTKNDNGAVVSFADAEAYCQRLSHGGHEAWRLPESDEFNEDFFKNGYSGIQSQFWSGPSPRAVDVVQHWVVDDADWSNAHPSRVLCVYASNTDAAPSTWQDPNTHLLWTYSSMPQRASWDSAVAYCAALTVEGIPGWRLPALAEIRTLYDPDSDRRFRGDIDIRLSEEYWTADHAPAPGNTLCLAGIPDSIPRAPASMFSFAKGTAGSVCSGAFYHSQAICVHDPK